MVIAVANQKGSRQTTTAVNLSSVLLIKGKRFLLDDPQGNATSGLGVDKKIQGSTYDVLINEENRKSSCWYTYWKFKIMPFKYRSAGVEVELVSSISESRLKFLKWN